MKHTIQFDGQEIELSQESFDNIKQAINGKSKLEEIKDMICVGDSCDAFIGVNENDYELLIHINMGSSGSDCILTSSEYEDLLKFMKKYEYTCLEIKCLNQKEGVIILN